MVDGLDAAINVAADVGKGGGKRDDGGGGVVLAEDVAVGAGEAELEEAVAGLCGTKLT